MAFPDIPKMSSDSKRANGPLEVQYESLSGASCPAFGEDIRKEYNFDFAKRVHLNMGSYGMAPKRVVDYK